MWETLLKAVLTAGAVWAIAALSAKLARKSSALEQVQREVAEREKVDEALRSVSRLSRVDLLARLREHKK